METKDICYECCQKYFKFDIKAPITDNTDIAELELSIRAYNCLKRAGYSTYGNIKNLTTEEAMEEVFAKIKEVEEKKE